MFPWLNTQLHNISYIKNVIFIYGIQILNNTKLCILSLQLPAGQHGITIRYVNPTTEETWWSLQLGVGQMYVYVSISVLIIGQMSCKMLVYQVLVKKSKIVHL